jgi:hypothetical protein
MLITFHNTKFDDDPQRSSAETSKFTSIAHDFGNRKRRRRSKKTYIPHRPLAKGYASFDTGVPWVKERSYVIRAGAFE